MGHKSSQVLWHGGQFAVAATSVEGANYADQGKEELLKGINKVEMALAQTKL